MHGRITLAPCGHTGETIIGSYVKCLTGCDGKPTMSARGEPGHVDRCVCVRCNIRRDSTHIVLRDRGGYVTLKCEWNGMGEMLTVTAPRIGSVLNYKFLDVNGATVALGSIPELNLQRHDIVTLNIKKLIAAIAEGRTAKYDDIVVKEAPVNLGLLKGAAFTPARIASAGYSPSLRGALGLPHAGTVGPVAAPPSGITPAMLIDIEHAALKVAGVEKVEVESLTTAVRVLITKFSSAINSSIKWDSEMIAAEIAVEVAGEALLPPNVACYALNRSPGFVLYGAVTAFDYHVKSGRTSAQAETYVKDAMLARDFHKVNGGQAAIDGLVVKAMGHRFAFSLKHDGATYTYYCPA